MLSTQKNYIEYLVNIEKEIRKTNLPDSISFNFEEKIELLKNKELIIPVIGAFSAGKSSLLNSFLGEKKLPEKITPETALATELRYSSDERIEAVGEHGTHEVFSINDMELLKGRASEFKYLRLYLKNDNLKNIEPLILVDMPGFESPLDLHNQAIMEYINKGVHYIVLTSVEDGTITRSMMRQLEDIKEYKREFSFFLSKTNLRPKNQIKEIKEHIEEQLNEYFDNVNDIGLVDDNGGKSLEKVITEINPETLFKNIFLDSLKDNFFSIKEEINTKISTLNKSKEQNNLIIKQLENALSNIIKKRNQLIEEAKNRYLDGNINKIVENVGKDLSNSLDELVRSGMTGDSTTFSSTVSEITKSSLISHLQISMSSISNDIIDDFSLSLSDLNNTMSCITLSENWLESITSTTKNMIDRASGGLHELVKQREKNSEGKSDTYKVITTILGLTTTVLTPIIELLIVFLPNIISSLFKVNQKDKQKEELKNTILTNTIPSIKSKLRSEIPEIFNTQVNEMIESVSTRYEEIIKDKQKLIVSTQEEIDAKNIDIESTIEQYKNANHEITTLSNNTLYKG